MFTAGNKSGSNKKEPQNRATQQAHKEATDMTASQEKSRMSPPRHSALQQDIESLQEELKQIQEAAKNQIEQSELNQRQKDEVTKFSEAINVMLEGAQQALFEQQRENMRGQHEQMGLFNERAQDQQAKTNENLSETQKRVIEALEIANPELSATLALTLFENMDLNHGQPIRDLFGNQHTEEDSYETERNQWLQRLVRSTNEAHDKKPEPHGLNWLEVWEIIIHFVPFDTRQILFSAVKAASNDFTPGMKKSPTKEGPLGG